VESIASPSGVQHFVPGVGRGSACVFDRSTESMNSDDVLALVLPQFFPQHWLEHPGIVYSAFPSCIRIGYVLRGEGRYSYVLDEQCAALNLTLERLHAAALENLARLPSATISIGKVLGGAEGWISAADDNFAAVRILLPEVQQEFCQELGDGFLLTLSHRDDCFCWSAAQKAERQAEHARHSLEAFLNEDYNLTPDILVFRDGAFHLQRKQSVQPADGID
jgi:uncharacterized protein YtpQ (UPF0354 family)